MKPSLPKLVAGLLLLGLVFAPTSRAAGPELDTVVAASDVVRAFSTLPLQGIPPAMLKDARGVAIIPQVVKAGFLVGGRFGRGVVLTRQPNGGWGEPVFVTLAGGSFGLQAGVQAADLVLVFKTPRSLDRVLRGGGKLTLGGDVGVAAGPVGRQAEAATDAQLKAEIYSYSRSRGLFAGVSLQGAALWADVWAGQAFYGNLGPAETGAVSRLKHELDVLSTPPLPVPLAVPARR